MWTLLAVLLLNGELQWKDYGPVNTMEQCVVLAAYMQDREENKNVAYVCAKGI